MTRKLGITPTLMSALTGDSQERPQGEVPKSIELPVEQEMSSCQDGQSPSSSYDELTVSSRQSLIDNVLQEYKDEQKKRLEDSSIAMSSQAIINEVLQEYKDARHQRILDNSSAALSAPKIDVFSKGSSRRSRCPRVVEGFCQASSLASNTSNSTRNVSTNDTGKENKQKALVTSLKKKPHGMHSVSSTATGTKSKKSSIRSHSSIEQNTPSVNSVLGKTKTYGGDKASTASGKESKESNMPPKGASQQKIDRLEVKRAPEDARLSEKRGDAASAASGKKSIVSRQSARQKNAAEAMQQKMLVETVPGEEAALEESKIAKEEPAINTKTVKGNSKLQKSAEESPSTTAKSTKIQRAATPKVKFKDDSESKQSSSKLSNTKPQQAKDGPAPIPFRPPNTMLGDAQTDVLARDIRNKGSINLVARKGTPFEPEWDELSQLLLCDIHADDPSTVENALQKLGAFLDDRENAEMAFGLGAHVTLSVVMRKFSRQPEIQRWGCFCVSNLIRTKPEPALAIVKSGGIEALMNAMQLFPDSFSIQTNGLLAVKNLLSDCKRHFRSSEADRVTQRFLHELNGLHLIVKAMDRFLREEYLQSICCELCLFLLENGDSSAFQKAGVARAVANAGENHPDLTQNAWRFMNMFFGDAKQISQQNNGQPQPHTKSSGQREAQRRPSSEMRTARTQALHSAKNDSTRPDWRAAATLCETKTYGR